MTTQTPETRRAIRHYDHVDCGSCGISYDAEHRDARIAVEPVCGVCGSRDRRLVHVLYAQILATDHGDHTTYAYRHHPDPRAGFRGAELTLAGALHLSRSAAGFA